MATKLCQTCLSADRNLFALEELHQVVQNIGLMQFRILEGEVCWECKSQLINISKFIGQAKQAQEYISYGHQILNSLSRLSCNSKEGYDAEYIDNTEFSIISETCTELVKEEEPIKEESANDDSSDDEFISMHFDVVEVPNEEKLEEDIEDNVDNDNDEQFKPDDDFLKPADGLDFDDDDDDDDDYKPLTQLKSEKSTKPKKLGRPPKKHLKKEKSKKANKEKEFNIPKKYQFKPSKTEIKHADPYSDKKYFDYFETVNITEEELFANREKKKNNSNYKTVPFKCDLCVLGFKLENLFKEHMELKHDEKAGEFMCYICYVRYPSKRLLTRHKEKHFSFFRCKFCKLESGESSFMVKHCREKHSGDKQDSIHCPECDLVAKSAEEYMQHMKTEHRPQCTICDKTFSCKYSMKDHLRRMHSVKREFKCDICKRAFRTKSRLETHMAKHSTALAQQLTYCSVCQVQYKTMSGYRRHLANTASHSTDTYLCSECGKTFVSKLYLKQHIDFIHRHQSKFKCQMCNKIFQSQWKLRKHHQVHHGMTRTRDFACTICGKTFFSQNVLANHMLTHSAERKYMCGDCGDTFKQSAALFNHRRLRHEGWKRNSKNDEVKMEDLPNPMPYLTEVRTEPSV